MKARAEVPTLSWPRLVVAQFGLIAKNGRWKELIGGALAILVLTVAAVFLLFESVGGEILASRGPSAAEAHKQEVEHILWASIVIGLAAVWATIVWRGESPAQRRYHWSLPAERRHHDLARVAAGALWLVVLVGLMTAISAILFPIDPIFVRSFGKRFGPDHSLLGWAAEYGLVLLAVYGLASVIALAVEKPVSWLCGAIVIAGGLAALFDEFRPIQSQVVSVLGDLLHGDLGLTALFDMDRDGRFAPASFWLGVAALGLLVVTHRRTDSMQRTSDRTR